MTKCVQQCLLFPMAYKVFGKTCARNQFPIIVLRFPELDLMSTRGHPRAALSMRSYTR